jgi:hypothetical protein
VATRFGWLYCTLLAGAGFFLFWLYALKRGAVPGADHSERVPAMAVLMVLLGSLVGGLAERKGYSFLIWFFAAGLLGLIVLAFLPFVNKGDLPAEVAEKKRIAGNMIGVMLAAALIIAVLGFLWAP